MKVMERTYRRIQCDVCRGSGKQKGTRRRGIGRTNRDYDQRKNRPCEECLGMGYIDVRIKQT